MRGIGTGSTPAFYANRPVDETVLSWHLTQVCSSGTRLVSPGGGRSRSLKSLNGT